MKSILKAWSNLFLPEHKTEKWLLMGIWTFYFSYSIFIALNTYVIDHPSIPYDIYFCFDGQSIFKNGEQNVTGHPFIKFLLSPLVLLSNTVALLIGYKAKTLLVAFLCAGLISYSAFFIFRYLKNIIALNTTIALLITIFYALFSTSLTLAFTPESFTISAFLLSFSLYYFSLHIHQKKEIPFLSYLTLTFITGGITVTNSAKIVMPALVEENSWKRKITRLAPVILIFGLALTLRVLLFKRFYILDDVESRLNVFSDHSNEWFPILQKMVSNFFGAPLLFPSYEIKIDETFQNKMILVSLYKQAWQYAFSILIISAVLYTFFIFRKNRLVQLLALYFSVDLTIHLLVRFGLDDAFLYGGHWVFIVPLLLGWLYHSLSTSGKKVFTVTLVLLILLTAINNLYRLTEFYHFAITFYHV